VGTSHIFSVSLLLFTPSRGREQQQAKIPFQIAYAMGFSPSDSGFCAEDRAKTRRIRGGLSSNVSLPYGFCFTNHRLSFREVSAFSKTFLIIMLIIIVNDKIIFILAFTPRRPRAA